MPSVITLDQAWGQPINLNNSSICNTILPHIDDDSILVSVVHEVLLNGLGPYDFDQIVNYLSDLRGITTRDIKLILSNVCEYKFDEPHAHCLDYFLVSYFLLFPEIVLTLFGVLIVGALSFVLVMCVCCCVCVIVVLCL
jgi:hypothetical protein